jgi:argininosuccinate synthase
MRIPRLVLAFAGGAEGAAAIPRLQAQTGAEIVTLTLDLGQSADLEQVAVDARAAGAVRAHVVDARDRFARDVLLPVLRAGAAGGDSPLGPAALARPVVASVLVEVARMEGATLVAHGATGADRSALDRLVTGLAPELAIVTLPHDDGAIMAWRVVSNLAGRAVVFPPESGVWDVPERTLFTRTAEPASCENHQAIVEIAFERGVPVAVSGIPMSFPEILEVLDTIAGDHGVGRTDMIRGVPGRQWREVGEAPASVALAAALAALERTALDAPLVTLKSGLVPAYQAALDGGAWFSSTRDALDALIDSAMASVTGTVRLMLFRGSCRVVDRAVVTDGAPATSTWPAGV